MYFQTFSMFFISFCLIAQAGSMFLQQTTLTKKHILRVPFLAPIGGQVNPMGDICLQSATTALDKINKNPHILPDYNLVIEIIDDECRSFTALERFVPELEKWKWNVERQNLLDNLSNYSTLLPLGHHLFENRSSSRFLTPPFFVGSPCSEVCRAIGRLPQHFGIVEAAVGCVDSKLDDRNEYRNFYRLFTSLTRNVVARLNLLLAMNWTQIAILSDQTQYTSSDSYFFMSLLAKHNITVTAEEFVIGGLGYQQTQDAVERLKNRDVRIIFALCYINTCPEIACAAYKTGLFGPTVVWIFNADIDFRRVSKSNCSKAALEMVTEGAIFLGPDATGDLTKPEDQSEIGISTKQITEEILINDSNASSRNAFTWRLICFESVHNAAFILHSVEESLRLQNLSLGNLIVDEEQRNNKLTEMIRKSILTLNISASWGPGRWISIDNSSSIYASPNSYIQQVQDSIRQSIFLLDHNDKLVVVGNATLKWRTRDGKAPRSQLVVNHIYSSISAGLIFSVETLGTIFILFTAASVFYLFSNRNKDQFVESFGTINCLVLLGSGFIMLALIFYPGPGGEMQTFCFISPFGIASGLTFVEGGLATQMIAAVIWQQPGRLGLMPRIKTRALLIVVLLSVIVLVLLALFIVNIGISAVHDFSQGYDGHLLAEHIDIIHWKDCPTIDYYWAAIAVIQVYAFAGICSAETIKRDVNSIMFFTSTDRVISSNCLYFLFPLTIVVLIAMASYNTPWVNFATLSVLAIAYNVACNFSFWLWWLFMKQLKYNEQRSQYRSAFSTNLLSRINSQFSRHHSRRHLKTVSTGIIMKRIETITSYS